MGVVSCHAPGVCHPLDPLATRPPPYGSRRPFPFVNVYTPCYSVYTEQTKQGRDTMKFSERVAKSERVNIEELTIGDVVLSDGMAVRVAGPARTFNDDTYAYAGTIINDDEIRDADGRFRWPFRGIVTEDLSWTIQRRKGIEVTREIR